MYNYTYGYIMVLIWKRKQRKKRGKTKKRIFGKTEKEEDFGANEQGAGKKASRGDKAINGAFFSTGNVGYEGTSGKA